MAESQYTIPDEEYVALLQTLPPDEFPIHSPEESRQRMQMMYPVLKKQLESELPDKSKYTVTDIPLASDGSAIPFVRVLAPTSSDPNQTFPILYWIHGGGFIMGAIHQDDYQMRIICVALQLVIVLIEYRLAPEYPHPTALNDCFEGLKWTVDNAASVHGDVSKGLIVGGDSAGANITAVITHIAREDPFFRGRQITGQVLHIPCVIDPRAYPEKYKSELGSLYSMGASKISGPLTPGFIRDMYEKHLKAAPGDLTTSPLLYPSHANLPPAITQISGLDMLRDEGILYDKLLREAGVKTRLIVYPGVPHGFHLVLKTLSATRKFYQDFADSLVWLLNGAKD